MGREKVHSLTHKKKTVFLKRKSNGNKSCVPEMCVCVNKLHKETWMMENKKSE